jgi:hypothetical protein
VIVLNLVLLNKREMPHQENNTVVFGGFGFGTTFFARLRCAFLKGKKVHYKRDNYYIDIASLCLFWRQTQ